MAKFARFESGGSKPLEEYDGDFMEQDKEYVNIFKWPPKSPPGQMPDLRNDLVVAIHLAKGQSARKISG